MKYNLNTCPCFQLNNCVFAVEKPKTTVLETKQGSECQSEMSNFFIGTGHWDSVELQGSWVKIFLKINLEKFRSVLWTVWQQNALKKD